MIPVITFVLAAALAVNAQVPTPNSQGAQPQRTGHLFPPENALERSDAAFVEGRAALVSKQGERSLVAPGGSIDPR